MELDRLQDRLNTLSDMLGPARARLSALLDRPADADLPVPSQLGPTLIELDEKELIELLQRSNPQIKALQHLASSQAHKIGLARRQYEPDIMLGVGIVDVAATSMSKAFPDSGKDAVSAIVSLNIPLWSGRIDSAVRQAQMDRQATLQVRMDLANQLQARLATALVRLRDARRRLDLYANGLIPKALQALEVTQEAFRGGTAGLTDVLDAQRTYLEFQLAHQRAIADHQQALAAIEALVGRQLTGMPETDDPDKERTDGS
ncbi:MAG: TolC family protein [Sedimentisphaerales bacterium]|nr:TolC family protein [Sedimentisphaerales bacterium]